IHHCRVHTGPGNTLLCELGRLIEIAKLVDARGNSFVDSYCYLHCVLVRSSEGSRYVAKPFIAATSLCAGSSSRRSCAASFRQSIRDWFGYWFWHRSSTSLVTGSIKFAPPTNDLG